MDNLSEFELGRQDALNELLDTINRRLKYMKSIEIEPDNMVYSLEKRNGIIDAYEEIIRGIVLLKNKERDSKRWASIEMEGLTIKPVANGIPDEDGNINWEFAPGFTPPNI